MFSKVWQMYGDLINSHLTKHVINLWYMYIVLVLAGTAALSVHGEDFFRRLNKLHVECQHSRDDTINQLDAIRSMQQSHQDDIAKYFGIEASAPSQVNSDKRTSTTATEDTQPCGEDSKSTNTVQKGVRVLRLSDANNILVTSKQTTENPHTEEEVIQKATVGQILDPGCTCGAEDLQNIQDPEIPPTDPDCELWISQLRQTDNNQTSGSTQKARPKQRKHKDNSDTVGGVSNKLPPKPVKGVAQARLVLKRADGRHSDSNMSPNTARDTSSPRGPGSVSTRRSPSPSPARPGSRQGRPGSLTPVTGRDRGDSHRTAGGSTPDTGWQWRT